MSLLRLSPMTLGALPRAIAAPGYDRDRLVTGIVHLGIGAFHRAHQAVYTNSALAAGDLRWGILGVSLRSPDTHDALHPQAGLYTLSVREADEERLRIIGSVRDVVVAPDDPGRVLSTLARPTVKIVSLTVTEKGYCHDPATGALREDHPDILHDLGDPRVPRTALGYIVAGLMERRRMRIAPFTVLCCDNLPSNGKTVKRVLERFAALRDPEFGRYLQEELACPATMVDRIVPATSDEDRARIDAKLSLHDAGPVVTEPFSQWVIEDHFPLGRPDWEHQGAQFTDNVAPFELMKLRLLNGAHSGLAYLGYLCGYETVAECMRDSDLRTFVRQLMDLDITPFVTAPRGADIAAYKRDLLTRFANSALKHRTTQIAMDGSQKMPQRWLETIRAGLAADRPQPRLALCVAAWMRYVTGTDEQGRPIELRDPLAAQLRSRADRAGLEAGALVTELLGVEAIFGSDLPRIPALSLPSRAPWTSLFGSERERVCETPLIFHRCPLAWRSSKMIEAWRWFGPQDPVSLDDIRQAGASDIVSALHDYAPGDVWSRAAIAARKNLIETTPPGRAALRWSIIESIPVPDDVKRLGRGAERSIAAWIASLEAVAACGLRIVCYNFMPVLDWTRTDLDWPLPRSAGAAFRHGAICRLRSIYSRPAEAKDAYDPQVKRLAWAAFDAMSKSDRDALTQYIAAGLPGGTTDPLSLEDFRQRLTQYRAIDARRLRQI